MACLSAAMRLLSRRSNWARAHMSAQLPASPKTSLPNRWRWGAPSRSLKKAGSGKNAQKWPKEKLDCHVIPNHSVVSNLQNKYQVADLVGRVRAANLDISTQITP